MANVLHANHNKICVIDTETTGLIAGFHEVVQIAIVPINLNFEPDMDVKPFLITMRPNHPDHIDEKALSVNGLTRDDLLHAPLTQDAGVQMFYEWYEKLALNGNKRLMPLGHNYPFDMGFLKAWLSPSVYDLHFHYHYRDSMVAAQFLNDKAYIFGEMPPFAHVGLSQLASKLDMVHHNAHNALSDALMCLKCYKRMFKKIVC